MAKVRKINSIEKTIQDIFKILKDEDIKKAINKSSSYLRKCGDDETAHKLQFDDAIKLDLICFQKNGTTPFFDLYKYQIEKDGININQEELAHLVNQMQIALGTMTKEYIDAIDDKSRGGKKITEDEKSKIFDKILSTENTLKKIRKSLDEY